MNVPGVKGTMWAAYNALGRGADTRLESLWFGQAGNLNRRAYNVALKMAA